MSLLSSIETTFSKIDTWFKKVFANITWEQTAEAAITVTAPLLETLVTLTVGSSAEAEVANVVKQVQTDLGAVIGVLNTSANATSLTSLFSGIESALSGLLTAGHITDTTTVSKVTSVVETILSEVAAIVAVIPKV